MVHVLTLRRSAPSVRIPRAARIILAAAVAGAISIAYVVQAGAQGTQQLLLLDAQKNAVAAQAAALAAGVPADSLKLETGRLARLKASPGPQVLPFIDQAWNNWAVTQRQGYSALAQEFRSAPAVYAASLLGETRNTLGAAHNVASDWAAAGAGQEDLGPANQWLQEIESSLAKADIKQLTAARGQAAALLAANTSGLNLQLEDNQKAAAYTQEELVQAGANLVAEQQRGAQLGYDASGEPRSRPALHDRGLGPPRGPDRPAHGGGERRRRRRDPRRRGRLAAGRLRPPARRDAGRHARQGHLHLDRAPGAAGL